MRLLLVLLAIMIAGWAWSSRHLVWKPTVEIETSHYTISSSATHRQTEEIGEVAETLYRTYMDCFKDAPNLVRTHPKLQIKLFKNRAEFRRCNSITGWEEAFYSRPYCYQYYSSQANSPYHWMLHEATHQLNNEVGQLGLPTWIDEGLACYFGTSLLKDQKLHLGVPDPHTYPIWWLAGISLSGDLEADIRSGGVIALRAIVTGIGGPDIDRNFNLYYIHWWSLAHFLFHYEDGKYCEGFMKIITGGASVEQFEKQIGSWNTIQSEWYGHLQTLCGQERSRSGDNVSP